MTYVDAFLLPVPVDAKEAYARKAARVAAAFRSHGALQVVECWGEERPDFRKAAAADENENVVLSWIIWPSKTVRDEGHAALQADATLGLDDPMFNPAGMLWGGFERIVDTAAMESANA